MNRLEAPLPSESEAASQRTSLKNKGNTECYGFVLELWTKQCKRSFPFYLFCLVQTLFFPKKRRLAALSGTTSPNPLDTQLLPYLFIWYFLTRSIQCFSCSLTPNNFIMSSVIYFGKTSCFKMHNLTKKCDLN